jgi:GGDEF domain-containing protein
VGIALYPEDGTAKDAILSAADASMYVAKHTRRRMAQALETQGESGLQ